MDSAKKRKADYASFERNKRSRVIESDRDSDHSSENTEEEDEVFLVEVLVGARRDVNQKKLSWEYLVHWYGYPDSDDSWEPEVNLASCERLVESFWKNIGPEHRTKKPPPEHEFKPKKSWIEMEKEHFYRENIAPQAEEKKKKEAMKGKSKQRNSKEDTKSSSQKKTKRTVNDSDDSDDVPLSKVSSKLKGKAVKKSSETTLDTQKQGSSLHRSDHSDSFDPLFDEADSSSECSTVTKTSRIKISASGTGSSSGFKLTIKPPVLARPSANTPKTSFQNPPNVVSGSSLSTKSRLGQSAVKPEPVSRSALANLSFKKNKTGTSSERVTALTIPAKNSVVASPTTITAIGGRPDSGDGARLRPSLQRKPSAPNDDDDAGFEGLFSPHDKPANEPIPTKPPNLTDASDFLETMSLPPAKRPPPNLPGQSGSGRKFIIPSVKIAKKWKWEGDMHISADESEHRLCQAKITDSSDLPGRGPESPRFELFLEGKSLHFKRLQDVEDFRLIFSSRQRPCQVAVMTASDVEEKTADFRQLSEYMHHKKQFTTANLYLDNLPAAILVAFPSRNKKLREEFSISNDLPISSDALLVLLVPWELNPLVYSKFCAPDMPPPPFPVDPSCGIVSIDNSDDLTSESRSRFHLAVQLLKFPKHLFDWMKQPNRPFAIFTPQRDIKMLDLEISLLQNVLDECQATHVSLEKDILRAVFMHVESLNELSKFAKLSIYKSTRPSMSFWLYGTSTLVEPERWGVREIWPLGGAVTFTVEALKDNYLGCLDLMRKLGIHAFWTCYLTPLVLANFAKVLHPGEDLLELYDSDDLVCQGILELVDEGKISVIRSTWDRRRQGSSPTVFHSEDVSMPRTDPEALLKDCLEYHDAQAITYTPEQWKETVLDEVGHEMAILQIQPPMMEKYRRFVVIGASNETPPPECNVLEWMTLDQFAFKDQWFDDKDSNN